MENITNLKMDHVCQSAVNIQTNRREEHVDNVALIEQVYPPNVLILKCNSLTASSNASSSACGESGLTLPLRSL